MPGQIVDVSLTVTTVPLELHQVEQLLCLRRATAAEVHAPSDSLLLSLRTEMIGEPGLLQLDLYGAPLRVKWTPDEHPDDGVWITPSRDLPVFKLAEFVSEQVALQRRARNRRAGL